MAHTQRKGVKRKRWEEDDDNYRRLQRKSIIDMSVGKLQTHPGAFPRVEPCLRRSVLILNTLKQIEFELQQEGVHSQSHQPTKDTVLEMSTAQLTLDPLPDMSTFMYPMPASSPIPMSVEASPGEGGEGSDYLTQGSSVVNLLPAKPLVGAHDQALSRTSSAYYDPSQSSAGQSSSVYFGTTSLDSSAPQKSTVYYNAPCLDTQPSSSVYYNALPPISATVQPKVYEAGDSNNNFTSQDPYTSYCNSLIPAFEDFPSMDVTELTHLLTLHESWCQPPLPATDPAGVSSPKSLDEFLHSLPDACDAVLASSPPAPPAPPASPVVNAQCSTYCRSDSTLDDLDSIMQILVGI